MLSKDFEIYYYNDNQFSSVSDHSHDYYEFYVFMEGNVSMYIGGRSYHLKHGDILLIPPGIKHHAFNIEENLPCQRFVFWISQEYCQKLHAQSKDYVYLIQQAASAGRYIFHFSDLAFNSVYSKYLHLVEEAHNNRFGRDAMLELSVQDLILSMNRVIYEQDNPRRNEENSDLLNDLSLYIDSHLDEDLSLDVLANQFFLSKYYISHYFKNSLGVSVHQYITKKRHDACSKALITGADITETFSDYGFSDYSSFYRAFKKQFGISPKEYKNMYHRTD
jgi:YesN/AraC family two-component response regulator